jgi:general secretion pathway protein G
MVTTDKAQGMQRKVVLVTVGVIALAVVAAKLFAPSYVTSLRQSLELTRRQNLLTIRAVLSQYTLDTHRRPRSLDDLVISGYLKHVPLDPMTGRKDTWLLKCSSDPASPGIVSISPGNPPDAIKGTAHCD